MALGITDEIIRPVSRYVPPERADAVRSFGESLPPRVASCQLFQLLAVTSCVAHLRSESFDTGVNSSRWCSFTVSHSTRELGLRIALGADAAKCQSLLALFKKHEHGKHRLWSRYDFWRRRLRDEHRALCAGKVFAP